ncbi:hypothetical protein ACP4OV_005807 [Aristida adscensionis]
MKMKPLAGPPPNSHPHPLNWWPARRPLVSSLRRRLRLHLRFRDDNPPPHPAPPAPPPPAPGRRQPPPSSPALHPRLRSPSSCAAPSPAASARRHRRRRRRRRRRNPSGNTPNLTSHSASGSLLLYSHAIGCLLAPQVGGDGGKRAAPAAPLGAALLDFARSNFLPLGLLDPTLGCLADKYSLSKYSTFGIFVISGLTLRTKELGAALEAWPAGLFGLASILLFTPFLAQFIMKVQFFPHEFITGLAMFCCMPTTLSSGVTLTQLCGGNSALALTMTVVSNLLGIITIPLSLAKYIGAGAGVSLPTEQLFKSLVTRLLIPLTIGKVARETSKGIADFVDGNRQGFAVASAILLSLVKWLSQ